MKDFSNDYSISTTNQYFGSITEYCKDGIIKIENAKKLFLL